jgi:hypothetical protein
MDKLDSGVEPVSGPARQRQEDIAVAAHEHAETGLAEPCSVRKHRLEHQLQLSWGTADHAGIAGRTDLAVLILVILITRWRRVSRSPGSKICCYASRPPIVFDHLGRLAQPGAGKSGFKTISKLIDKGKTWVDAR